MGFLRQLLENAPGARRYRDTTLRLRFSFTLGLRPFLSQRHSEWPSCSLGVLPKDIGCTHTLVKLARYGRYVVCKRGLRGGERTAESVNTTRRTRYQYKEV